MGAPSIAIMTDATGWHTRQLQAALRARGGVGMRAACSSRLVIDLSTLRSIARASL